MPTYESEFRACVCAIYLFDKSVSVFPFLGKVELPEAKLVVEKVLLRRHFIPDPQGTSLMFAFFAQHFTHQFFKSDLAKGPAFTKSLGHGVSVSWTSMY